MESWMFHLAHLFLIHGYIEIPIKHGHLFSRLSLVTGFLLLCDWSIKTICSPLVFTWNAILLIVNVGHLIHLFYTSRKVNFSSKSLERVFNRLFAPMGVSRLIFQRMSSGDIASVHKLEAGEAYAIQDLTKNDRLGLLISGRANVMCNSNYFHPIEPLEFMDSPEFESSRQGPNDTMKVSIIAAVPCRYVSWERSNLEYHLLKEALFAHALALLVARDVCHKLFTMNKKITTAQGVHLDIRLVLGRSCSLPLIVTEKNKERI